MKFSIRRVIDSSERRYFAPNVSRFHGYATAKIGDLTLGGMIIS